MSNVLAVFDIGPPLDTHGKPQVIGEVKYTSGITRSVIVPALGNNLNVLNRIVAAPSHLGAPSSLEMQDVQHLLEMWMLTLAFDVSALPIFLNTSPIRTHFFR